MKISEIYHDLEIDNKQPIKTNDTIRVFHGFNDFNQAILTAKKGLSGAEKVPRVYSYESDNNPKGLFVTGRFKDAEKFVGAYNFQVIMEFDANYNELEAPVWPGGSWTGWGEYSQNFGWGAKGRRERINARKEKDKEVVSNDITPEWVKLSDQPYMADLLLNSPETQALFIGHLNPKRIKNFYVKKIKNQIAEKEWKQYTKDEFLTTFEQMLDDKHKNTHNNKMFEPDEEFDPEVFKQRLQQKYSKMSMDLDSVFGNMWKRVKMSPDRIAEFKQIFGQYFWPKQLPAAIRWLNRTYKNY